MYIKQLNFNFYFQLLSEDLNSIGKKLDRNIIFLVSTYIYFYTFFLKLHLLINYRCLKTRIFNFKIKIYNSFFYILYYHPTCIEYVFNYNNTKRYLDFIYEFYLVYAKILKFNDKYKNRNIIIILSLVHIQLFFIFIQREFIILHTLFI